MKINDKFSELDADALTEYRTEVKEAFRALVDAENPTDEQIEQADALAAHIEAIDALAAEREEADAQRTERLAALRDKFAEDENEEGGDEDEPEAEEKTDDEPAEDDKAEVEVEVEEPAEVKVAAGTSKVARLASKTKRPAPPVKRDSKIKITAAADVHGFSAGQGLDDLSAVAAAVISRAKGFTPPTGDGKTVNLQQFGTAMFELDFAPELTIDRFDDAQEVMDYAVKESRLPGGSLTAAGGWCAPSETVYDITDDSTAEGMVSLPEVAVKRGGMRYALSPTFAEFYANPGFIQTEAQAIAGTTKPCVEVDCPDFTEVRLDAEGICIKVPILTNAAYPEVVRNFISGSMTAHQHWINANVIGRMVTAAGAARVFTGLGTTYGDALEALGLVIDQTRQKYRLSLRATVEVVVPFWVRNAFRADLSKRAGQFTPVTDQQLNAHFATLGANVQYVYDWQAIDETAEAYPDTFNALVYPAGTFVKGTAPVINLNTVYDAASLQVNTYTGLFMEQGLLVAMKKFHADLLTLPICNAGRVGAHDLTCV